MHDVEALHRRLGRRPVAAERGVHGVVDPTGEGLGAGLLGLPDVDVAQVSLGVADAQVQDGPGDRFGSEVVDDLPVELVPDRDVLDVGVDHGGSSSYLVRMSVG